MVDLFVVISGITGISCGEMVKLFPRTPFLGCVTFSQTENVLEAVLCDMLHHHGETRLQSKRVK